MLRDSDKVDRRGIHIAAAAFESIGFAFREQATSDFGIDAHLEPRAESGGTGELLALQIKSGESYFREVADDGWWLRSDQRHTHYWLQHVLPVLVVQVDLVEGRVFWEAVTKDTVQFTEKRAKILIRRDHMVDERSLRALRLLSVSRDLGQPIAEGTDCRVFLARGIPANGGWNEFAKILIHQLVELGCVKGWDIVVTARTAAEDDELTDTNDYGDVAEDLVSINVDAERHVATYVLSSRSIYDIDLWWNIDRRAEAEADAVVYHLMAAEGLLDDVSICSNDQDDWDDDEP